MQMYLISDNVDTEIGMRLVGVPGCVVHEADEIRDALDKAMSDPDIGIILITEKLMQVLPNYIYEIKTTKKQPLLVPIPDRHGRREQDSIMRYVSEAIGLKVEN